MAVRIVFTKQDKELFADASQKRSHKKSAEVTENKVESGADIADHVITKRDEGSIEGVVSAYPLKNNPDFDNTNRVQNAIELLEKAINSGELLDIHTTLKTYSKVVLTDLQYDETTEHGAESLFFSISFIQVEFANAKFVKIPVSQIGKGKVNETPAQQKQTVKSQQRKYAPKQVKGTQPTKPATEQQAKVSQEKTKAPDNTGAVKKLAEEAIQAGKDAKAYVSKYFWQ